MSVLLVPIDVDLVVILQYFAVGFAQLLRVLINKDPKASWEVYQFWVPEATRGIWQRVRQSWKKNRRRAELPEVIEVFFGG